MGSCNGFVTALELETGQPRWIYDTRQDGGPVEFHGDALHTRDLVILGSDWRREGGVGRLYALAAETGIARWKHEAGSGVATNIPMLGGTLFAVTLADELIAVDVDSGTHLWSFPTGEPNPDFIINSTPAVSAGRVYFGGLDGSLQALDEQTGSPIWKRSIGPRVTTSILLADGSLFAGTEDKRIHRVDPADGRLLATMTTEEIPVGRLASADGCVLAFLGERLMSCADPSLEKLRWTRRAERDWSTSRPYPWRSYVLAADSRTLHALRLTDGTPAWSQTFTGVVRGVGIAEDALYVGTLGGAVHALRLPDPP